MHQLLHGSPWCKQGERWEVFGGVHRFSSKVQIILSEKMFRLSIVFQQIYCTVCFQDVVFSSNPDLSGRNVGLNHNMG